MVVEVGCFMFLAGCCLYSRSRRFRLFGSGVHGSSDRFHVGALILRRGSWASVS